MKKFFQALLLVAATTFVSVPGNAQDGNIADLLHFTAVARDTGATPKPITNSTVYVNVKIYTGNPAIPGSTVEYCEQTDAKTNAFGEFSLEFGTNPILLCPPQKQMSEVPWHTGDKWVDIRFQTNAGAPFIPIATFKLTSVPYAFASRTSERTVGIETAGATTGQVLKYDGQKFKPEADKTGDGIPVGTVMPFAGPASKVPLGWFLCDGAPKNRATYGGLFDVIGNYWGPGDGVSTFNLPDLRGQFLRGASLGSGIDPDVNSRVVSASGLAKGEAGSKQEGATARPKNDFTGITNVAGSHEHDIPRTNATTGNPLSYLRANGDDLANGKTKSAGNHSHTVQITGNGDNETRPKNVNVNYWSINSKLSFFLNLVVQNSTRWR